MAIVKNCLLIGLLFKSGGTKLNASVGTMLLAANFVWTFNTESS